MLRRYEAVTRRPAILETTGETYTELAAGRRPDSPTWSSPMPGTELHRATFGRPSRRISASTAFGRSGGSWGATASSRSASWRGSWKWRALQVVVRGKPKTAIDDKATLSPLDKVNRH